MKKSQIRESVKIRRAKWRNDVIVVHYEIAIVVDVDD